MSDKQYLNDAAEAVAATLPDHHGFILLAVPCEGGDGRLKYISSLSREDAIKVMREFLFYSGAGETWMKHLDADGNPPEPLVIEEL